MELEKELAGLVLDPPKATLEWTSKEEREDMEKEEVRYTKGSRNDKVEGEIKVEKENEEKEEEDKLGLGDLDSEDK